MKKGFLCLVLLMMICGLTTVAHAEMMKSFSATQVVVHETGAIENSGKLYMHKGKIRFEMRSPAGSGQWIIISRPDINKHWMVNPEKKMYFEQSYSPEEIQSLLHTIAEKNSEKILSEETIQGFKCKKMAVTTHMNVPGMEESLTTVVWQSGEFPVPIRAIDAKGRILEFRDIKAEIPDKALFDLPADYEKAETMVELFAAPPNTSEN